MAFRTNPYLQSPLFDRGDTLPAREQDKNNPWARAYADYVLPAMNESLFAVLTGMIQASRSNTPSNMTVLKLSN